MKNNKRSRNLWLFSGLIWSFVLFRRLPIKQISIDIVLNTVTAILSFVIVYIEHKKITKDNTY